MEHKPGLKFCSTITPNSSFMEKFKIDGTRDRYV